MILIVISSASSPTVALAFQEVFVHVTELLFPPQGLLACHSGTGGTWGAVPDVANAFTGFTGRRQQLQQGGET